MPPTVNPQGVASVAPTPTATPTALPQAQAPVASPAPIQAPNFNVSQTLGNIADYYNIPRQTANAVNAGQTQANVDQSQFEAQKYQNSIQIQNQQDSLDPSKYTIGKNPDGSIKIVNGAGQDVSIGQYAALTGADPAKTLASVGVTDKAGVQFQEAYSNLQDYIQNKIAAQNGDQTAAAKVKQYVAANTGLGNLQLGQLQQLFMQQYGSYFGEPSSQGGKTPLAQSRVSDTIQSQNASSGSAALQSVLASLQGQ